MERRKLSDIVNGDHGQLALAWQTTKAADEFGILPPGEYVAHVISGDLDTARTTGTPEYRLTFKVIEGEYTNRLTWHHLYLTAAALPMAKRDLAKLGVHDLEQLERPLPQGIRCKIKLTVRKDDRGNETNRLRTFEVVGVDPPPPADPFAPADALPPATPPPNGQAAASLFAPAPAVSGPYREGR